MGHGNHGGGRRISSGLDARMSGDGAEGGELVRAVKAGQLERAYALLHNRGQFVETSLDWQDPDLGGTALYWASCYGYEDFVRTVIGLGGDINRANGWRATPLHAAADNNHVRVCRILIKNCADVNAQTVQGDTPCHLAAYRGNKAVVEALQTGGADLSIRNRHGKTILDEARGNDHHDIVRMLEAPHYKIPPSVIFTDDYNKEKNRSGKCRTIYNCSDNAADSFMIVPSNRPYGTSSNVNPLCSQFHQLASRTSQFPFIAAHAYSHGVSSAHAHRHASWTGPESIDYFASENSIKAKVKGERRISDSDLVVKDTAKAQDLSMNFNTMDYELMKEKKYQKDLSFK